MQLGFEASELSESSIERMSETQERKLVKQKLKLKKLIKSKQSVKRVFSMNERNLQNLADQNQSCDINNAVVM